MPGFGLAVIRVLKSGHYSASAPYLLYILGMLPRVSLLNSAPAHSPRPTGNFTEASN